MTTPQDIVTIARSTSGPATSASGAAAIFAVLGTAAAGSVATAPQPISNDADPTTLYTGGPVVETSEIISSYSRQATIPVRAATAVAGAYGSIVLSGFTGTALPVADSSVVPYIDSEAYVIFDTGGALGDATQGITYRTSKDNGRTFGEVRALGSATYIDIDDNASSKPLVNARIQLGAPSAQVTAFIAAVVEARADTLAHLADVTAHDAADTSAAQVALAASSPPTTEAQAVTVMGLILAAYASHRTNITAHNGPDPVNVVSAATPVTTQDGIGAYLEYRTDYNAHLGIALAANTAGLRAATATVTSPVTLTAADLLDAGEALLAVYPRRVTFTTAGGTPADAPATATITGINAATGASDTEVVNLAQTATTVSSTKAWSSITSIVYTAGDGTGATVAIGYGQAVHNSADVTNTLVSAAPTRGTVVANDVIKLPTTGPTLNAAGLAAAFTGLAAYNGSLFGGVVIPGKFDPTVLWSSLIAGLDLLRTNQIPVIAVIEARPPADGETAAQYRIALTAEWAAYRDERVHVVAGRGRYDPTTLARCGAQLLRSHLSPLAARLAALDYGESPGVTKIISRDTAKPSAFGGPLDGFMIYDSAGALIGHDERINSGLHAGGFSVTTSYRRAQDPTKPYVFQPKNKAPAGNTAPHIAHQRVVAVIEGILYQVGTEEIESRLLFEPGRSTIRSDVADAFDAQLKNRVLAEVGDPLLSLAARISELTVAVDRNANISTADPAVPIFVTVKTAFYASRFPITLRVNPQ